MVSNVVIAADTDGNAKPKDNLPWVEKYRPSGLEDLVSHTDIISTLTRFIAEDKLPHLLFYGPPGTGKTSTVLACARQMYTPEEAHRMVLELNASDDRGINVVREQIVNFASSRSLGDASNKLKLIVLDEADAMTRDAQNALRRIIEKYTSSIRFCIICNYLSKIIPALQSRCTRFRFAPLSKEQMLGRLKHIVTEENVDCTEDGENALLALSHGDMRRVLNVLQVLAVIGSFELDSHIINTWMAFNTVSESTVHQCVGHPLTEDVQACLNHLLNSSLSTAYDFVRELQMSKGLALQDILNDLQSYILRLDMPSQVLVYLMEKMSEVEYRLCSGASDKVQLSALVSAFVHARALVGAAATQHTDELH